MLTIHIKKIYLCELFIIMWIMWISVFNTHKAYKNKVFVCVILVLHFKKYNYPQLLNNLWIKLCKLIIFLYKIIFFKITIYRVLNYMIITIYSCYIFLLKKP